MVLSFWPILVISTISALIYVIFNSLSIWLTASLINNILTDFDQLSYKHQHLSENISSLNDQLKYWTNEMGDNLSYVSLPSGRTVSNIYGTDGGSAKCIMVKLDNNTITGWGTNNSYGQILTVSGPIGKWENTMGNNLTIIFVGYEGEKYYKIIDLSSLWERIQVIKNKVINTSNSPIYNTLYNLGWKSNLTTENIEDINPELDKRYYQIPNNEVKTWEKQIKYYNLKDKKQGAWHHDADADISMVVPLNTGEYEGGGTEFFKRGTIYPLPIGNAMLFPSFTHMHRGLPVQSGDRYLLVFWLKAAASGKQNQDALGRRPSNCFRLTYTAACCCK